MSRLVSGIILLIVVLGVASAQLAAVLERRREFAVLVGARHAQPHDRRGASAGGARDRPGECGAGPGARLAVRVAPGDARHRFEPVHGDELQLPGRAHRAGHLRRLWLVDGLVRARRGDCRDRASRRCIRHGSRRGRIPPTRYGWRDERADSRRTRRDEGLRSWPSGGAGAARSRPRRSRGRVPRARRSFRKRQDDAPESRGRPRRADIRRADGARAADRGALSTRARAICGSGRSASSSRRSTSCRC